MFCGPNETELWMSDQQRPLIEISPTRGISSQISHSHSFLPHLSTPAACYELEETSSGVEGLQLWALKADIFLLTLSSAMLQLCTHGPSPYLLGYR